MHVPLLKIYKNNIYIRCSAGSFRFLIKKVGRLKIEDGASNQEALQGSAIFCHL